MKRTTYIMIALLVAKSVLCRFVNRLGWCWRKSESVLLLCRWKYVRPIRQAAVFRMFQVWKTV